MLKRSKSKVTLKNSVSSPDWFLVSLVLGLTIFGIIMVGSASVVEAFRDFGNKLHYLRLQAIWAAFGFLAFCFLSFFDYHHLKKFAFPLMVFSFICLILVLIPGIGTKIMGARRWLPLGFFGFQPAELTKLTFILYLALFFSNRRKFWSFLFLLGILLFLIMLEPDLGTAVILSATALVVYFVSGAPLLLLAGIGLAGVLGGAGLIFSSSYRRERLMTFLNPSQDPLGASYHIRQILIAIGSGGLFGVGLGQSRQKYEYLPEVTTDSIFAVIAEELGFIGSLALVIIFLMLVWRGMKIAKEAPDEFGKLLAVGITSWIGFQALVNLSAMVAIVPLTGVPLPFISYGGSSLVLCLAGMGILANIARQKVIKR
ncbi:MAG: putative lipid II flippase FtsW [Candidatus Shapirobacteria bacterium]|nr:putative lipid II flippase FtsW [Candidatus Shapirobacteria bacterium]